jgi:methionyl-tRNA formyltransferase
VVYARKITKADGRVDWTRPATELWNQVRGLTPWPGAFTYLPVAAAPESAVRGSGVSCPTETPPALLKLWKAERAACKGPPGTILESDKDGLVVACGQDALRILELQTEGKRRMTTAEFLSGHPLRAGDMLGNS